MERKFNNIAKVMKDIRISEGPEFSQRKMGKMLGFKNGQYISNIERGLCSIPPKVVPALVKKFMVSEKTIIDAMIADYRASLEAFIVVQ